MTVYPGAIDSNSELISVNDNITEIGGQAINQLRDAVFSIEETLGINPHGSLGSVADRLNVSLNANGTIKASALTAIGLIVGPIVNSQVAVNAGILESKLALDYSTSSLHTALLTNQALTNSLAAFATIIDTDLLSHIAGATFLSDGITKARHVISQIDLNAVPSDTRDPAFVWTGLKDKHGVLRSATQLGSALLQINNDLVSHETNLYGEHPATAITVDSSEFQELPLTITNAQEAFNEIDNSQSNLFRPHRANLHANGVNRTARSVILNDKDGYSQMIVPPTLVQAYLIREPAFNPVDSVVNGDDVIKFTPDNSGYIFDSQFSQVRVGDIVTINYGRFNVEASFPIESIRFIPGVDWTIRINGVNLLDTDGYAASARIDRSLFDTNTYGVLACASVNNNIDNTILGSIIIADPSAASTLGISFDASKFDNKHYNLYLQFYPDGTPTLVLNLPPIDVTGNAGETPGFYRLEDIVQNVNNAFRSGGYNFRMIAFSTGGEFGLSVADKIGNASFSIINGTISGSSLTPGSFGNNVVGDATDGVDPFGFGINGTGIASPSYQNTYTSSIPAQFPTKIIVPLTKRNFDVNGTERNTFVKTHFANADGYWPAEITQKTVTGSTVEVSYTIPFNLDQAGIKIGKTIVVQPISGISDVDYGRFIIKQVGFTCACDNLPGSTIITVVNGIYSTGNPISPSAPIGTNVQIYFSADSVCFDNNNLADSSSSSTLYRRFHEIYIDDKGSTFSHERARMLKQSETSELLNTSDYWQVKSVSPKLRGYIDGGVLSINKFVRLYILSFNTVSGEFDGYLGKRSNTYTISNTGIITTGRKNVPVRFYDETNIDFIEMQFLDTSGSTGTNVLSYAAPRYVDIQIFPTLETDDQFMLLATCEVNGNIVTDVKDARQFGNVSEKNFTNSALDFIRSGDRHLHENGVIRGFEFQAINIENSKLLNYSGGLALVNGVICTRNNGSVEIPNVYLYGTGRPQSVKWAVCVNEQNQFYPIIITDSKTQYFSENNKYIESVSFKELVNSRKDLCIISYVSVLAVDDSVNPYNYFGNSSFVITDARRYITSEGLNNPLVWVGGRDITGQFKTFEAVKTWINNYGANTNKVIVRGEFTSSSTFDFSDFNKPVVFEGENCIFTSTAPKCITLGSNVTIRGFTFIWSPVGFATPSGNFANTNLICTGNGCIYVNGSFNDNVELDVLKDSVIENCVFSMGADFVSATRPSFINIQIDNQFLVDGLIIRHNKFNDTVQNSKCAAISIISSNLGGAASNPGSATISNSFIENNICNLDQGIVITSKLTIVSGAILSPGIASINTFIRGNNCGWISYVISSGIQLATTRGNNRNSGLTIEGNSCLFITNTDETGAYLNSGKIQQAGGNVNIINNHVSWIWVCAQFYYSIYSLIIKDNNLNASNNLFFTFFGNNVFLSTNIKAIYVTTLDTDNGVSQVAISGNIINSGIDNVGGYDYNTGIHCAVSGTINNNSILAVASPGGIGIKIEPVVLSNVMMNVSYNLIKRGGVDINSFITITPLAPYYMEGFCTDNTFDQNTIDGTDTNTIVNSLPYNKMIIERNKGQNISMTLQTTNGIVEKSRFGGADFNMKTTTVGFAKTYLGDPRSPAWQTFTNPGLNPNPFGIFNDTGILRVYTDFSVDEGVYKDVWWTALNGILPNNVTVDSVSVSASANTVTSATDISQIQFLLVSNDTGVEQNYSFLDFSLASGYSANSVLTVTASNLNAVNSLTNNLTLLTQIVTATSGITYYVKMVEIKYHW